MTSYVQDFLQQFKSYYMSNEITELKRKNEELTHLVVQLQGVVIDLQRQYTGMSTGIGKQGAYIQQVQHGCGKILGDFEKRLEVIEAATQNTVEKRPTLAEVVSIKLPEAKKDGEPENIPA